ncbi:MAG: OmpA family protein [Acidobacteriota bacterium]
MRYAILLGMALAGAVAAAPPAPERMDLLDMASGALVVSSSGEYGAAWTADQLIDGTTESGWCNAEGKVAPNTMVIELAQPFAVTAVAADNTGAQDGKYAGISARQIVVSGSTTSPSGGFVELVTFEAPKGGRKEVPLPKPATAQWLRFEIRSNWGNPQYTELMELEAYGTPVGPPPKIDVSGDFETDAAGMMRLEQNGAEIRGCYDCCSIGRLSGSIEGRVLRLEWREDEGADVGSLLMVASRDGNTLTGLYFRDGKLNGEWNGRRVTGRRAACRIEGEAGLAGKLSATGSAVLYGIVFDSDSATIRAESEPTLNEVLAVLKADPKRRLLVCGHTDSTNTDAYNLRLSQERADAVVTWLTSHGCAGSRLQAKGFGESQPVTSNATAAGRALNRRVEVRKLE